MTAWDWIKLSALGIMLGGVAMFIINLMFTWVAVMDQVLNVPR